ncbi:GNAT family N-acetyltransferase [Streptomyces scopuliridis]|uniref:GNAT family N-acetyltransferase n=1 Tax=Streptomyces scopuliridis TaxID=452529 RepID=UPI0036CEA1DA
MVGAARGQGVATEALRAVAAWALGDLQIPRLQLHFEPWNAPGPYGIRRQAGTARHSKRLKYVADAI